MFKHSRMLLGPSKQGSHIMARLVKLGIQGLLLDFMPGNITVDIAIVKYRPIRQRRLQLLLKDYVQEESDRYRQ